MSSNNALSFFGDDTNHNNNDNDPPASAAAAAAAQQDRCLKLAERQAGPFLGTGQYQVKLWEFFDLNIQQEQQAQARGADIPYDEQEQQQQVDNAASRAAAPSLSFGKSRHQVVVPVQAACGSGVNGFRLDPSAGPRSGRSIGRIPFRRHGRTRRVHGTIRMGGAAAR